MDPPELGARDCEKNDEDENPLVAYCKELQKGTQDGPPLIGDSSTGKPRSPHCSTMRATYKYPVLQDDNLAVGKRRAMLLAKFYKEAAEELEKEHEIGNVEPDYCTEYDGNFNIPGFEVDDTFYVKDAEAFRKYPLYSSVPASFYSFNLLKNPTGSLKGLTTTFDPTNPFKKCASFSKPISEVLDPSNL